MEIGSVNGANGCGVSMPYAHSANSGEQSL
jgi:hypothetical protein